MLVKLASVLGLVVFKLGVPVVKLFMLVQRASIPFFLGSLSKLKLLRVVVVVRLSRVALLVPRLLLHGVVLDRGPIDLHHDRSLHVCNLGF